MHIFYLAYCSHLLSGLCTQGDCSHPDLGAGGMSHFPQLTLRWERTWAQVTGLCCFDSFYSTSAYQHSNFPGKQAFIPQSKNYCSQMHLKLWIPFHSLKGVTQLVVFNDLLLWGYLKVMNSVVSYYRLCYMDVWRDHGIGEGWQVSKSTVNAQCRKG